MSIYLINESFVVKKIKEGEDAQKLGQKKWGKFDCFSTTTQGKKSPAAASDRKAGGSFWGAKKLLLDNKGGSMSSTLQARRER